MNKVIDRWRKSSISVETRAMVGSSIWLLSERVARLGLTLLTTAWLARYLGPAAYGHLAYSLALIFLVLPIAQLGLSSLVVRDLVRRPNDHDAILGTSFLLRLGAGIVAATLCIGTSVVRGSETQATLLLTCLVSLQLIFQAIDVPDLWFQSRSLGRQAALSRLAISIGSAAIKIAAIMANAPLWLFGLLLSLEVLGNGIALNVSYRRMNRHHAWAWDSAFARQILMEAWPYALSALMIGVYMRADQIIISQIAGPVALGLYAAVLPFSQFWQVIPMTIATAVAPRIVSLEIDGDKYSRLLRWLFFGLLIGMLLISASVSMLSPLVVNLVLGQKFLSGAPILAVHVFTNVFISIGVTWQVWAVSQGKGGHTVALTGAGACVSIIGNLLLIPRFGPTAVPYVAVLAQATAALLIPAVLTPSFFVAIWGRQSQH